MWSRCGGCRDARTSEEWIQIAHDALDICTYVAEELYSGGEHEVLWEIMCLHMNAGLPMPSWVTETIAESKDDSWEKLFGPVRAILGVPSNPVA